MKSQPISLLMKQTLRKSLFFAALSGFFYFWPFLAQGVLFDSAPKIIAKPWVAQSTFSPQR